MRMPWVVPVVVVLLGLVAALAWVSVTLQPPAGSPAGRRLIIVEVGEGFESVAREVAAAGLIRNRGIFRLLGRLRGTPRQLRAGTYAIDGPASMGQILSVLERGRPVEVEVLLVEGWTAREMGQALDRAGVVSAADFLAAVATTDSPTILPDASAAFLAEKPATAGLEGYLFPDTYRFRPLTPAAEVIRKLLDTFGKRVTEGRRAKAAERGQTFFEVLTLASIVEREVRTQEDRQRVADIFWRRLAAGRRLEADSTVNYVTGKNLPAVTSEDLAVDSPFNTYKHAGLPPGPIGNPGLASLEAVLNPEPNAFWYFLTDRSGQVHYSRTFEEHVAKKAQYLK